MSTPNNLGEVDYEIQTAAPQPDRYVRPGDWHGPAYGTQGPEPFPA